MSSRKPTQEIYHPPKYDTQERTFYNSSHKKKADINKQSESNSKIKSDQKKSFSDVGAIYKNYDKQYEDRNYYHSVKNKRNAYNYKNHYETSSRPSGRNNDRFYYSRNETDNSSIIERNKHDSYNKEFNNDSRLFNPYKSDEQQVESPVSNYTISGNESDNHIHGGLIRLPNNVDIQSNKKESGKTVETKPTVMVRPTFSQVNPLHIQTSYSTMPGVIPGYYQIPSNFMPPPPHFIRTPQLINPTDYNRPIISPNNFQTNIINIDENMIIRSQYQLVNQSIDHIKVLESQMDILIRDYYNMTSKDWWESVNKIREELKELYKKVIVNDLDYCNRSNIEQNLWKSTFYSVMELIRNYLQNPRILSPTNLIPEKSENTSTSAKELIITQAQSLIKTGTDYFLNLYREISRIYQVDLEVIFNSKRPPPETNSRTRKLVYLSTQKLLLFLGDLARYSEIIKNSNDYSQARLWYLKANLLLPQNGRPYNQLAVISVYVNRYLDALYYYTRTLAATNPFSTATQSLSFLFEETRKKNEELVRREQEDLKVGKQKRGSTNNNVAQKGSIEVWIHPDDGTKERKVFDDDNNDELDKFTNPDEIRQQTEQQSKQYYANLSTIDLNRKFIYSFLNGHGKLFNKINMEQFPEVCSSMLSEFGALISRQPCPLNKYRLCHLLMINMYILDHVCKQTITTNSSTASLRTVHQDHASRMTMDFFAILCQRSIDILEEWLESEFCSTHPLSLPEDLSSLLTATCLWTDWMVTRPEYWNPLPTQRDPLLPPSINDFEIIARLCTLISKYLDKIPADQHPKYRIVTNTKEAEQLIGHQNSFVLFEESLICGFLPMLDQIAKIYYLEDKLWNCDQIQDWIHLEKIGMFGEYLTGRVPPILEFDIDSRIYKSNVIKEGSEKVQEPKKMTKDEIDQELDLLDDSNCIHGEYKQTLEKIIKEHKYALDKESLESLVEQMKLSEPTDKQSAQITTSSTSWADITEEEEEQNEKMKEHHKTILDLKLKIAEQKYMKQKNENYIKWRQSIIDSEYAQKYLKIVIKPLYLVFDTNCFVDSWKTIQKLGELKKFIIIVPIIVINELENLSRQRNDLQYVSTNSKKALEFLESRFAENDSQYRAITAQGTELYHIRFRCETLAGNEGTSNDDIILHCASQLINDKPSEFMARDKGKKPITLVREVVLITGDRILRVKAKDRNIPVRPMNEFITWLKPNFPFNYNNSNNNNNNNNKSYKNNNSSIHNSNKNKRYQHPRNR